MDVHIRLVRIGRHIRVKDGPGVEVRGQRVAEQRRPMRTRGKELDSIAEVLLRPSPAQWYTLARVLQESLAKDHYRFLQPRTTTLASPDDAQHKAKVALRHRPVQWNTLARVLQEG